VATATDGQSLIALARKFRPQVIVTDINMPQLNGLDACEQLRKIVPESRTILLTVNEDAETAQEAIRRGAFGYLLKKSAPKELFEAIQAVAAGRVYLASAISRGPITIFVAKAKGSASRQPLTMRQREVLQLLAEGKSMKEAADVLKVAVRTIAFHKYSMMQHLGITRNSELVMYAAQAGLGRNRPQP